MKKLVFLGLAAILAACTPAAPALPTPPPNPRRSPSPVVTASATPSLSPSPFTQELSAEQQAALDAVKEYYRVYTLVASDPAQDTSQLTRLYRNSQLAVDELRIIERDRDRGLAMTGELVLHFRSVGEPVDAGGMRSIEVHFCSDNWSMDIVDAQGNSDMNPNRTGYVETTFDMVYSAAGWLINDYSFEDAEQC